jgi:hypothetical protein
MEETEELIPGVFIHKQIISSSLKPNSIGTYILNVEVKLVKILTLELSLENFKNIQIDSPKIEAKINPFENKEITRIILFEDWEFTPKYNIKLEFPPKEIQENFIKNDVIKNDNLLKECYENFFDINLELFPPIELENLLDERKIEKFVDYEFPPNDISMKSKKNIDEINDTFHWRRPEDFILLTNEKNIVTNIIIDNPEPNDIIQETFSDNNFISSIGCIAEKSNLIKRLFVNENISNHGFYIIKLCIKGQWKKIIIDDLFPCYVNGNPYVSHSPSNEIWVLLLEKAVAKYYGSYFNIINIKIADFLLLLTGCPTFFFLKNEFNDFYNKIYDYVKNKNYLVVGLKRLEQNEYQEDDFNSMINPSMGYTILDIEDKGNKKFVLLRRILFSFEEEELIKEYQTNLFKEYPDLQQISFPGTLILDYDDFTEEFSNIYVCYAKNWEEMRLNGKFIISKNNNNNIISNYFYTFDINSDSNVIISLFQDEDSIKGNDSRKPMMDISLSLLKYDKITNEINHVQTIDFTSTPSIQMEFNLPSGSYIIYPRTSGCFIGRGKEKTNLKDFNNNFTEIFINVIKDIFEKYDLNQTNKLGFKEFNCLMEDMTNSKLDESGFNNLLRNYSFNQNGFTDKSLIKYFEDSYDLGENKIREWLKNLGYDNDLYCRESRKFNITIHCNNPFTAKSQDSISTGINGKLNKILLKFFGEERKVNNNDVSIVYLKSKLAESIITLGCKNNTMKRLKVTLNFNDLNKINTNGRKECSRIIEGNDIEYFMQILAANYEDFENMDFNIKAFPI